MSEESNNSKSFNMLQDHRKMLIMSGNISDFQLDNMKKWPFILFSEVEEVRLDYDFSEKVLNQDGEMSENIGSGSVIYKIKVKNKEEEQLETSIKNLSEWTRFLFWNETKVEVEFE